MDHRWSGSASTALPQTLRTEELHGEEISLQRWIDVRECGGSWCHGHLREKGIHITMGRMTEGRCEPWRRALQNSELVEPNTWPTDVTTHSHLNDYTIQVIFRKTWQPGHDVSCSLSSEIVLHLFITDLCWLCLMVWWVILKYHQTPVIQWHAFAHCIAI